MARSSVPKQTRSLSETIQVIQTTSQMKRADYNLLVTALLSGQRVAEVERGQMSRILDALKQGKVQIVD